MRKQLNGLFAKYLLSFKHSLFMSSLGLVAILTCFILAGQLQNILVKNVITEDEQTMKFVLNPIRIPITNFETVRFNTDIAINKRESSSEVTVSYEEASKNKVLFNVLKQTYNPSATVVYYSVLNSIHAPHISIIFSFFLISMCIMVTTAELLNTMGLDKDPDMRTLMRMHGVTDLMYFGSTYLFHMAKFVPAFFAFCLSFSLGSSFSLHSFILVGVSLFFGFIPIWFAFALVFLLMKNAKIRKSMFGMTVYYFIGTAVLPYMFPHFLWNLVPGVAATNLFTHGMTAAIMKKPVFEKPNDLFLLVLFTVLTSAASLFAGFMLSRKFSMSFACFNSGKVEEQSSELEGIDSDVIAEKLAIEKENSDRVITIRNVRKEFPGGKVALRGVSFGLESKQVFGLLGPNGAGKSTLMQIIGSIYTQTSGSITIHGYDTRTQMNQILDSMGYCPQHSYFWPTLTVRDHLEIFARFKGIPSSKLVSEIDKILEVVKLTDKQNSLPSKISGGEMRRVSIAIALLGDSKVVLLDEPTTGLDPEITKFIWALIQREKKNRLILLTTHSMEEAETLSDKLTIMAKGTLRCIGTPLHLKKKFGGDVVVEATVKHGFADRAVNFFLETLGSQAKLSLISDNVVKLVFKGTLSEIAKYNRSIKAGVENAGILHWGISQPTLDQVFVNVIKEADAEA